MKMAVHSHQHLGDNVLAGSDGELEGSVAFSDISFPSHVSDLESFHSDFDISMSSRASMSVGEEKRKTQMSRVDEKPKLDSGYLIFLP